MLWFSSGKHWLCFARSEVAVPDGHSVTAVRCVVLLDTFCVFLTAVSSYKVEFSLVLFEQIRALLLFEHILAHQVFVDVPN